MRSELTLTAALDLWHKHGGSTFGPRVEHVSMKESDFLGFCNALLALRSPVEPTPSLQKGEGDGAGKAHEFIVVLQQAWMNAEGYGINYGWDGERFATLAEATKHGWETRDSDDFNIAHVDGDKLLWFGWMDEQISEDDETMSEIADAIGLEFDPLPTPPEPSP